MSRAAGVVRERVRVLDRRPAGREVRRPRLAARPPTQLREWVSRLSFIGSTVGVRRACRHRYASLDAWADATEEYGAALGQAPDRVVPRSIGARRSWGTAGTSGPTGGATPAAGSSTSSVSRSAPTRPSATPARPVLVDRAAPTRSVVRAGRGRPAGVRRERPARAVARTGRRGRCTTSTSAVIAPDPDGFRIGLAMPDDGVAVAVPRSLGDEVDDRSVRGRRAGRAVDPGRRDHGRASRPAPRAPSSSAGATSRTSCTCTARSDGTTSPPGLHEVP